MESGGLERRPILIFGFADFYFLVILNVCLLISRVINSCKKIIRGRRVFFKGNRKIVRWISVVLNFDILDFHYTAAL